MLLVFINLKGRKKSYGDLQKQQPVYNAKSYNKENKKTHDKPVSVDLQRVQKRQVSSFFHGPIAASFALGPEKEKKIIRIPRNEKRAHKQFANIKTITTPYLMRLERCFSTIRHNCTSKVGWPIRTSLFEGRLAPIQAKFNPIQGSFWDNFSYSFWTI